MHTSQSIQLSRNDQVYFTFFAGSFIAYCHAIKGTTQDNPAFQQHVDYLETFSILIKIENCNAEALYNTMWHMISLNDPIITIIFKYRMSYQQLQLIRSLIFLAKNFQRSVSNCQDVSVYLKKCVLQENILTNLRTSVLILSDQHIHTPLTFFQIFDVGLTSEWISWYSIFSWDASKPMRGNNRSMRCCSFKSCPVKFEFTDLFKKAYNKICKQV